MWLRWWRKLKESFKKKSIFEESKYMYKHKHNILSSVLHISHILSLHTNMYVIYLDKYAMYVAFYRDTSALFGSWVPLSSFLSLLLLLLESNYFLPSSCQCWMFFLWRRREVEVGIFSSFHSFASYLNIALCFVLLYYLLLKATKPPHNQKRTLRSCLMSCYVSHIWLMWVYSSFLLRFSTTQNKTFFYSTTPPPPHLLLPIQTVV